MLCFALTCIKILTIFSISTSGVILIILYILFHNCQNSSTTCTRLAFLCKFMHCNVFMQCCDVFISLGWTHLYSRVQGAPKQLSVLSPDVQQVHFGAAHYDPGQRGLSGAQTLYTDTDTDTPTDTDTDNSKRGLSGAQTLYKEPDFIIKVHMSDHSPQQSSTGAEMCGTRCIECWMGNGVCMTTHYGDVYEWQVWWDIEVWWEDIIIFKQNPTVISRRCATGIVAVCGHGTCKSSIAVTTRLSNEEVMGSWEFFNDLIYSEQWVSKRIEMLHSILRCSSPLPFYLHAFIQSLCQVCWYTLHTLHCRQKQ